jgi:hemoglobin-like flavoprotein
VFKFEPDEDYRANPKFVQHARAMVDMTDCAVSLLGPDLDPLAEDLHDLGKRHVEMYGVQIEFLPTMEKAIMYAIEELVGDKLTKDDRNSWSTVFHYLITHMRKGMKMAQK